MTTPDKEEMPTKHRNAGPCLREALALVAGGFEGEGLEIENEWRRSIARNALNGLPLSEYQVSVARRYLSTLPVNNRHHSGSDNERLRKALSKIEVWADDRSHLNNVFETIAIEARAALNSTDRQTSDDVERLSAIIGKFIRIFEMDGDDPRIDPVPLIQEAMTEARAALKGVPQPASDSYQAGASAPALSEKFNDVAEWLPIETAPKNGTRVLIFRKSHVAIGQFDDDKYLKRPVPFWSGTDAAIWGKAWAKSNAPTHWMPLPSPPGAQLNFSNEPESDAVSLNQSLHHTQSKEG